MNSLRRIFRFVRPYRWQALLAIVLLAGMVVSDLAIPRLTQAIIDQGISERDMQVVGTTALMMLGAALLSALFAIANTLLSVRVAMNTATDIRSAIVRKVQTFSFGNLDRIQSSQLLTRTTSDANMVMMMVLMSLRILTRAPLWMIGSVFMLISTGGQLAWLILAILPVIVVLIVFFTAKARPAFMRVQEKLDRLNMVMQESLEGIRVVKAFVRHEHEHARFERVNRNLTIESIRVHQLLAVLIPMTFLLVNLGMVGIVWFGGRLAILGDFKVGQIVASVNYMMFSIFPLMMLGMMMGPLAAADASAERILEVLDSEPDVQSRPGAHAPGRVAGRVAFEDVCFSYDHVQAAEAGSLEESQGDDSSACGEPVLTGVDLVAEPGQTVAILGATGSGKSTLVHLIPRFYDVDSGRVMLDGVDVRDIPLRVLRGKIGLALQEAVLFSGTIRDNIRYGNPDATDEEVVAAAKAAQAHDFIMSFPDGYDTQVRQRGVNLSGGQKQRIAIARALLVQPRVLILDDSTSAVDVETEVRIETALEKLMARTTTFVVAQRISTVLNADKIVVLDRGQVAAEGTHAELMASSPIYREIYESQLGDGST